MTNSSCLFCKIIEKKIPAYVIYEDEKTIAFLDIMPHSPGHTMVIPKHHASNFLELPTEEVSPLFLAVKIVAELLSKKLRPDGITIGINQGRASGQEVDHLHIHLMPRWHGDGGSAVQSVVDNKPEASPDAIRSKIVD